MRRAELPPSSPVFSPDPVRPHFPFEDPEALRRPKSSPAQPSAANLGPSKNIKHDLMQIFMVGDEREGIGKRPEKVTMIF